MARTRQRAASDPQPIGDAVDTVVSNAIIEPDVFDQAIAAQQAGETPQTEESPATTHASRVSPAAERTRTKVPDPFSIIGISLTEDNDGPKARLLRNSRQQTMEIQFDENPGKEITDQIKAEGWRWESRAFHVDAAGKEHRGAWVTPLDLDQAWRTHADAERLLKSVANQIREKNGLEPVSVMGVMDR